MPESDQAFCQRHGRNCGSLSDFDNCGNVRTLPFCGNCAAPLTCGGGGQTGVCGCTGETDAALCSAAGKDCGTLSTTDRCGVARSPSCGSCSGVNTCGAVRPNECGCVGETDAQLCSAQGAECGALTRTDRCGVARSVASCGQCVTPLFCGARGLVGRCGCAESDTALCVRLGATCGGLTGTDTCGQARTVASCGTCTSPNACGAVLPNVCGCVPESDAQLCTAAAQTCGVLHTTDRCNGSRRASCGVCPNPTGAGPMAGLQASASWPMGAFGPHRQSRSSWPGPSATPSVRWSTSSSGYVASVVSANGSIFSSATAGITLRALSPSGMPLWTYGTSIVDMGPPAIAADGTLWAGAYNGTVHAVTAAGASLPGWPRTAACTVNAALGSTGRFVGGPVIDASGAVYLLCDDGKLYRATPSALTLVVDVNHFCLAPPAVGADGTTYLGSETGRLFAITSAGTVAWSLQMGLVVGYKIRGLALSTDGQTVYAPMSDGVLRAVKSQQWPVTAERGTLKWSWAPARDGFEAGPAIAADGAIIFGTVGGSVYAINDTGTAGTVRWTHTVGNGRTPGPFNIANDYVLATPLIARENVVYVGTVYGYLHGLDITTGAVRFPRIDVDTTATNPLNALSLTPDGHLLVHSGSAISAVR